MKKSVKYITSVYYPRCDYCNSNLLQGEEYYFVTIEGNELTDVRIVHRECFNRSRVRFIDERSNEHEDKLFLRIATHRFEKFF